MSGILLIGTDGGKRRFYFEQAAAEGGASRLYFWIGKMCRTWTMGEGLEKQEEPGWKRFEEKLRMLLQIEDLQRLR